MKRREILPPGRLCLSERLLMLGMAAYTLGMAGGLVAMATELPWVVIFAVAIAVRLIARSRKKQQEGGIHGDAHFATPEEVAAAGLTGGGPGIVIGKLPEGTRSKETLIGFRILTAGWRNIRRIRYLMDLLLMPRSSKDGWMLRSLVRVPESEWAAHIGFHLPTGAGKTRGVVMPSLLMSPENAVVYDPSGEVVRAVAEHRRVKFGKKYALIDPFLVSGAAASDRINVFDLLPYNHPGMFDFCNYLANAMVVEKPESQREPFWHGSTVLATVFQLLAIALNNNPNYRHLVTVSELLNGERLRELATALTEHPDPAMRRRAEQILNYKGKTYDSLLACLTTEHGWLDSPAYSEVLSDSTFRLQGLLDESMDLYICVPGHRAKESQPFVRLLLTAVLFIAFEAGPDIHRRPIRLYLDEIATLGQLELLMSLYTQGRKYGLRSASFFQNVGQVAEITGSPEKIQTVRGQFAVELFKARDYQTAKDVSEWIGSRTVETVSTSQQWSRNSGWSNSTGSSYSSGRSGGWSESTGTTVSETGVPVIRPEQVLQMQYDEAIMAAPGIPPVRVKILNGDDVKRCADDAAVKRYQRKYLRRVRLLALVMLPIGLIEWAVLGHLAVDAVRNYEARQQMINAMPPQPQIPESWQTPFPNGPVPYSQPRRMPVPTHYRRGYQ